jgi:hypothetical protein
MVWKAVSETRFQALNALAGISALLKSAEQRWTFCLSAGFP